MKDLIAEKLEKGDFEWALTNASRESVREYVVEVLLRTEEGRGYVSRLIAAGLVAGRLLEVDKERVLEAVREETAALEEEEEDRDALEEEEEEEEEDRGALEEEEEEEEDDR